MFIMVYYNNKLDLQISVNQKSVRNYGIGCNIFTLFVASCNIFTLSPSIKEG